MINNVVTRFAPSPTGSLHIGGARTAMFNWLFARANNGTFILRIDDTDFERSEKSHVQNIMNSLRWLGLDWDNMENEMYQSQRIKIYQEVANALLSSGHTYKCYATVEESENIQALPTQNEKKLALRAFPEREEYTVRFKMPFEGEFQVYDTLAGNLVVKYENLDDVTLLRSDGIPTYMLSSVVDDHETGITHIIRGQEHLYNAYRQLPIIHALGYETPSYTHIPLIHDTDGKKLSKRTSAVSVYEYQTMGILPEALCNYMLRLGWGHGDTDIISMEDAKKIFSLDGLGKAPARFDINKLMSLNSHYIKTMNNEDLIKKLDIPEQIVPQVRICLDNMKEKADSLQYINEMAHRIFSMPTPQLFDTPPQLDEQEILSIQRLVEVISEFDFSSPQSAKQDLESFVTSHKLEKRKCFMFIRIALTGMKVSPGLFEIMCALGHDLCKIRMEALL
jgi:glutamyl-tRNA synthetase